MKILSSRKLTDNLSISSSTRGFVIHDKVMGFNIVIYAVTEEDALIEAVTYYQKRFSSLEARHSMLKSKVNNFLSEFGEDYEVDDGSILWE